MLTWATDQGTLSSADGLKSFALNRTERRPESSDGVLRTFHPAPNQWWQVVRDEGHVLPVFAFRGRILVGPNLSTTGVCPTCLMLRLAQAFPQPDILEPVFFQLPLVEGEARQQLLDALDQAASAEHRVLDEPAGLMLSAELGAFASSEQAVEWQEHRVLPPPGDHPWHHLQPRWRRLLPAVPDYELRAATPDGACEVVDRLVGPLVETRPADLSDDGPADLVGTVAVAGFLGRLTSWAPDVTGSGLYYDQDSSAAAALGEAVERYCGNYPDPRKIIRSTQKEISSARHARVLGPSCFGGWSESEPFPGYGFRRSQPDLKEDWVRMTSPATNHEVFAPAEAVLLNYTRSSGQSARFPVVLAGIAAGRNLRHAASSAYLELLERDASMAWWHGASEARRLLGVPDEVDGRRALDAHAFELEHFVLPTANRGAACVASVLRDLKRDILVMGFACRTDLASAIQKAVAECWQLQKLSTLLNNDSSAFWGHVRSGKLPLPTIAFRHDRSYRLEFADRYDKMDQLAYNLQFYLDPEAQTPVLEFLANQPTQAWDEAVSNVRFGADDGWDLLVQSTTAAVADLTTPDMRACGYTVARVIDPQLVGNYATAFTPWWHPRLAAVPIAQRRSWPLPHA